jgi:hypothetical protein
MGTQTDEHLTMDGTPLSMFLAMVQATQKDEEEPNNAD